MATTRKLLFCWRDVEALPDLRRLGLVLDALPDAELVGALEARRGRGRNDYPVAAMWRALMAGVVFQHASMNALSRELGRNAGLLELCGFDPLPRQRSPRRVVERDAAGGGARVVRLGLGPRPSVPSAWNFSRFVSSVVALEEERGLVSAMIARLREGLMEALPDYGRHLGYDGKALSSHSTGRAVAGKGVASDPEADWGRHESGGPDARTGTAWRTVKTWFGYGLHLIADVRHEVPVAFAVTRASASEVKTLEGMLGPLFAASPGLASRCADFSADRGLDSGPLKARLWDDHDIRPLIDTRELWRQEKAEPGFDPGEPITRALFAERADTMVHTEKGEVFCQCPETGEQRSMAFQGFEAGRGASGSLKYRCPAAAYDLECKGRAACERLGAVRAGAWGRVVRIDLARRDRRIFTPTPHGSPSWRRGYKRRAACERIDRRIDRDFGFEDPFIRGHARMRTRIGLAVAVMMALALGHIRAGRPQCMRSLVGAVPWRDTG